MFIASFENMLNVIQDTIKSLNEKDMMKTKVVPMMLDIIDLGIFKFNYNILDSVSICIAKETLNKTYCDFSKNVVNIISSNELDNTIIFMKNYLKLLEKECWFLLN